MYFFFSLRELIRRTFHHPLAFFLQLYNVLFSYSLRFLPPFFPRRDLSNINDSRGRKMDGFSPPLTYTLLIRTLFHSSFSIRMYQKKEYPFVVTLSSRLTTFDPFSSPFFSLITLELNLDRLKSSRPIRSSFTMNDNHNKLNYS